MDTVYIEIDGAAGGDEGKLFAIEIARMYKMWAEKNKLKVKEEKTSPIVLKCCGENAYSFFAHEGGVHRVQRVPETEKRGRIHTSTVTVNVYKNNMPKKIEVNLSDCEITACRSSGKGGQKVNKTSTQIQILHKPTGIRVYSQEERSQLANKERALEKLQEQLQQIENDKIFGFNAAERREQVGTGNRNEKIRTYNYHDNRVIDHRSGFKSNKLKDILNGNLNELYLSF